MSPASGGAAAAAGASENLCHAATYANRVDEPGVK
jgi:hypothetical protein